MEAGPLPGGAGVGTAPSASLFLDVTAEGPLGALAAPQRPGWMGEEAN